jgi:hypothetical protein
MRAICAIFGKDEKLVDYLKMFKKILTKGE